MVAQREKLTAQSNPSGAQFGSGAETKPQPEFLNLPDGTEIGLASDVVRKNGEAIDLTPSELRILRYLAINVGNVIPHDGIVKNADLLSLESLKTYIKTIRKKLKIDPGTGPIKTVHGFGYMLDDGMENPEDIITAASGIELNSRKKQVKKDGHIVHMALTEYRLIELLAVNMGSITPWKEILDQIWEGDLSYRDEIKTYLRILRRKLRVSSQGPIRTLRHGLILFAPEMEEAERARIRNLETQRQ